MGQYPEFFYDDLPCDPCEGCSAYFEGICILGGACSEYELEEILEMLGVTDK